VKYGCNDEYADEEEEKDCCRGTETFQYQVETQSDNHYHHT